MTERLYYRDPSLLEFDGTIISSGLADGRYRTVLDRSAFYPTSGGQLFDTGILNNIAVVEVLDEEANVVHITEGPVGKPGDRIHGAVDRQRRQMHRQQHTAQHILSQLFIRQYQMETVSVHLGDEYGAIELGTPHIESDQLREVEFRSNDVLFANWPVEILFVSGEELEQLPLRKIPSRTGELRVIKVGEFDYSACGGTHCNSTSQVGNIKIIGWEKQRGHALVKFLAGLQAAQDYQLRFNVTDNLSKSLTCHVRDLAGKVDKLSADNSDLRKQLSAANKELLPAKAIEMAKGATTIGPVSIVYKALEGVDASSASFLATLVAERIDGLVMFVADGRLLISVGPGCGLHAGDLARHISSQLGLKGGGSNRAAQLGGADPAKLEEYKTAVLSQIGHA